MDVIFFSDRKNVFNTLKRLLEVLLTCINIDKEILKPRVAIVIMAVEVRCREEIIDMLFILI